MQTSDKSILSAYLSLYKSGVLLLKRLAATATTAAVAAKELNNKFGKPIWRPARPLDADVSRAHSAALD